MRFSIGDLVTERKSNYWYFHSFGFHSHSPPYENIYEYWSGYEDYDEDTMSKSMPIVGIVMDVETNDANSYYTQSFFTYRIWWINCSPDEGYLMQRWFYEDELRLLSKINTSNAEPER